MGRLKKWVKAVSAARKREAFSTAFAHVCAAIFNLSINMRFTPTEEVRRESAVTRINTGAMLRELSIQFSLDAN